MKNKYFQILLYIISKNENLDPLLKTGLEYPQIANLILEAKNKELIKEENGKLVLTDSGINFYNELKKQKTDGHWVMPDDKSRIEKLKLSDIFVPKKKLE